MNQRQRQHLPIVGLELWQYPSRRRSAVDHLAWSLPTDCYKVICRSKRGYAAKPSWPFDRRPSRSVNTPPGAFFILIMSPLATCTHSGLHSSRFAGTAHPDPRILISRCSCVLRYAAAYCIVASVWLLETVWSVNNLSRRLFNGWPQQFRCTIRAMSFVSRGERSQELDARAHRNGASNSNVRGL